ncbi:hypothetical protein HDV57DRAFT_263947 [Trichoderma longibrachiatum]
MSLIVLWIPCIAFFSLTITCSPSAEYTHLACLPPSSPAASNQRQSLRLQRHCRTEAPQLPDQATSEPQALCSRKPPLEALEMA